jgi:hypothetical protein
MAGHRALPRLGELLGHFGPVVDSGVKGNPKVFVN